MPHIFIATKPTQWLESIEDSNLNITYFYVVYNHVVFSGESLSYLLILYFLLSGERLKPEQAAQHMFLASESSRYLMPLRENGESNCHDVEILFEILACLNIAN